jgi:CheY-like chemotaxis protein
MLRVLIADDEEIIADSLAEILGGYGYCTTAAYSGTMAVDLASSFRPDVVISDVVMPGLNGIEACQIIRQKFPSCRILLFSGQATTHGFLDPFQTSGAEFEILSKPLAPKVLLAYLSGAVSGFRALVTGQQIASL